MASAAWAGMIRHRAIWNFSANLCSTSYAYKQSNNYIFY